MSVFDLPWLPMPQQQQYPPGDGHEGAGHGGSGDYGGGGDQGDGAEGGADQSGDYGGGVAGGRGMNPGRGYGGEAAQPGGRGQDEGWDAVGGSYDSEDARALAKKHGFKEQTLRGLFEDAPFPGLLGMAIGAVAKSMKNNAAADALADEVGIEGRMARSALGIGGPAGGDQEGRDGGDPPEPEEETDDDDGKPPVGAPEGELPKPGTQEYRELLLQIMEEMLGNMPDGNYEVPDWSVLIAQDGPRPGRMTEPMDPQLMERMDSIRTQAFVDQMAGSLLVDEERG